MTVFIRGKDAFSFAFTQYTDTVYRVAVHNTRCKSDAEDVTQEVFVKLLESSKIQGRRAPKGVAYKGDNK